MKNKFFKLFSLLILIIGTVFYLLSFKNINKSETTNYVKLNPVIPTTEINWIGQWQGEGDKEKFLTEIANEYEFMHQDVKVNLKFRDDVYNAKDEAAFIIEQMKKPVADWDIIVRVHVNYQTIANELNDPNWGEKYLVDFSKIPGFIESHKDFIKTDMYKKRYGNVIFGPFNEGQLCTLYVNTEVAKKMGIEVKQYGMTFDDFLDYIKKADEYNKSHDYIAPIFEDANWIQSEIIFKNLFFSLLDNYDEVLDTRLTPEKLKALETTYKACEELSKYNPIIRNRQRMNWGRDNIYPLEDSCLFMPNYTFMYNIWKMKGKEKMYKILPCELPVFKPSTVYLGGYVANWAVLKNAPHKDEAIKLMMYWCKPEVAEKWVRYTKSLSGIKGNLTTNTFGVDPFENFMYTIDKKYNGKMIQELDNRYILGDKLLANKNFKVLFRVIDVLEGHMTAEQAMDDIKRNI